MSKNSSEELAFTLRNYGDSALNGLAVNIVDEDITDGVDYQLTQSPAQILAPGAKQTFKLKITAENVVTSQARFSISATTDEGSYEEADILFHLVEAVPIAIIDPISITAGINLEDIMLRSVNINNIGYDSMNNVNISEPSHEWISVTPSELESISPGQTKTFDIIVHPTNDTAPGVYQETITISSSNHQPVNIYLTISVTSSQQGDLLFHVVNDISQNLSGASIVIQNQDVLTQVFTGTTNETGYYLFNDISTGRYNYIVKASGHDTGSDSIMVSPLVQTLVEPVLPKNILGVEFTVTPIQIEDDYDIVLDFTFETEVPPPLLIPSPTYIKYGVNFTDPENETDGTISISNPGLISVFNVTVDSSLLAGVNITFPTGKTFFIDEIKAESSITIPYHLNVTSIACGQDSRRNNIAITGNYITFEENSDITHTVYLHSEIPVFAYMYNCPVSPGIPGVGEEIVDHFTFSYNKPKGTYSPNPSPTTKQIQTVETVRERVKFTISQGATLERDAFAASLELTNKLSDNSIDSVKVQLEIKDSEGTDASNIFFMDQTFLENLNSIDGTGIINPSTIATADWLLVPMPGAGGTSPDGNDYTVQAFIDYTVDGVPFSVNSTEERINVMPQPLLNLTYMIPGEVKADTPFNITLNVTNVGYGTARNLKLDSAQPVIYENLAGLLVSFELIGSGIEGGAESDSMLINFGDIAPRESKTGYWIMTASLDGEFTEFKGSFSHSNALGGDETSLIKHIRYIIPGTVHNINNGNSFASIQAAINDADIGDELHADSGNYNENIVIDKQLILRGIDIGSGKPVINAGWESNAVTISADGVILDGFVVTRAGTKAVEVLSNGNTIINNNISSNMKWGIHVNSSNNNEINSNVVNNNKYGIYLSSSSNNKVYNNKLIENDVSSAFDDNLNQWDNGVIGNHYSENNAIDIDRNGICDNPYFVVGGDSVDNYPIYIPQPNTPPVVSFIYAPENQILINQEVTFDATASYDKYGPYDGGEIVSYKWDFGDGFSDTGPLVSHIYSTLDDYIVTLTLIDDDGGISSDYKVVEISSEFGENVNTFAITSGDYLDEINIENQRIAEDGDYFYGELKADTFEFIVDGFFGIISVASEIPKYEAAKNAASIGSSGTGDVAYYYNHASKSLHHYNLFRDCALYDRTLLTNEVLSYTSKYYAYSFANKYIKYYTKDEIKDFIKLKMNEVDGNKLQHTFVEPLDSATDSFKNEIILSKSFALDNVPSLSEDEEKLYDEDVRRRKTANLIMKINFDSNSQVLHDWKENREIDKKNWFEKYSIFAGKFLAKTLAVTFFDGPGAALTSGAITIMEETENTIKLEQDAQMIQLAYSLNHNSFDTSKTIYLNTIRGLDGIRYGNTPQIAKGNVINIEHKETGKYIFDLFGKEYIPDYFVTNSYSEITIKNTGEYKTTYVIYSYYLDSEMLGTAVTPIIISPVAQTINPGRELTVRIYYLQDKKFGKLPDEGTLIFFNVFGITDTGTYYVAQESKEYGTIRINELNGLIIPEEEIKTANILTYPISTAVKTPEHNTEYKLKIWIENPFKAPTLFNLSQEIPNNITITSASNGTIQGNLINWDFILEPYEYRQLVVTFTSNGEPGVRVELPQTELNIYDPINNKTVDFLSNSNNFTTKFPIDIRAYPPVNASIGKNIVVPINITNVLSDASYEGDILLEFENFEGVKVYSLIKPLSLAPSETQEVDLVASPDVDPGIYIIKGTWQGTKSNISIFTSYISIDAGDVLGIALLQNQYNNKGTKVELGGYNATTFPDGSYTFVGIPIGTYLLTISHPGYSDYNGEVMIGEGLNEIPEIVLEQHTPPPSITNLRSTNGTTWINWTWTNPPDSDFNHTEIYLDGTFQTNTSAEFFNATGLIPNTEYEISTRTADNLGNINETWVNDTAITLDTLPVSNASGPYTGIEGKAIIFNASASYDTDPGDSIAIFEWDFNNDGATDATGMEVTWTWNDDYAGQVNLTVADSHGESSTDTTSVNVLNAPPVVEAGNDQTVDEGDTVSFIGNFTDPGTGDTHTIEWNFGDGTPGSTGTLEPTHVYADNGTYTVTLTVTDDNAASTSDTLNMTVENIAPIVDAGVDQIANEGDIVSFVGNFTDPGTADTHLIEWDFGDETPISSGTLTPTHTYTDNGTYAVNLTVTDDDGASTSDTLNVTVNNVAPVLDEDADQTVQWGDTMTFSRSFTDPGDDSWTAEIDWGDGSQEEGILSSKIITATHVYSIPDEYICTLTVLDDDGGLGSGNMQITVTTRATELEYIGDLSAQYSDYIKLKAQLNDSGNNNPLPDRSISFILGTQTATATTGPDGIATTSFKLDQPAGSYDIKAEFAGDESYSPISDTKAMQISKEDAEITYTGDTILPTTAGSIDLRATLEEIDTDYGDLTKINVNFTIYKSDDLSYSNPIATIPSVASISVTSSGVGVGTATATIDNLPEDDYIIVARIVPNDYYQSISSNPTPMIVYEPTDQFTTGGGWIWDPTESHGNFGFNVKYNKNGKVQGNSIYVYRLDELDYIVKSNAWIGLAISDNTSTFQGKAVLQIFDPVTGELQPESSGNFQFTVEAMDNELNGNPDYYMMTVLDKDGLEYHNATGSLEGGNIVIHDKKSK
jgi:parallel beta-helix repeat protein